MRFLDLRLIAYGPFTDRTLDLSGGEEGLHVVYGANEAGKSASLRAISALLYGIPLRTQDNFLHPYPELRLGARLRRASGEEAVFLRRKARDKTLLDAEGNPLPDDALTPFLDIADADLFARLHGIDHTMLLAGGQEMKELKGHIGETLFSAGLGSGVNALLTRLAEEEKSLAAPRSALGITRLLTSYKELRKESNTLALRSDEWQETDAACRRLRDELTALDDAILAQGRERSRLERMARNLPRFARRSRLLGEIEALQPVIKLPDTYSAETRQKTVSALEQALAGQARITKELATLADRLATLRVPQQLLDHGERIEQLFLERNTHLTAATDRGNLVTKRIQYENDARLLLRDLAPGLALDQVEDLRLTRAQLVHLRELCVEYRSVHQRPQQLADDIDGLGREIEAIATELAALPQGGEPQPLARLLRELARQGDQERELHQAREEHRAAEEEALRGLASLDCRLSGDQGLKTLLATIFPAPETVDRFDGRFRALDQELQRLTERQKETTDKIDRFATEIEALQKSCQILTEADLLALRSNRDATWQMIKKSWLDHQPPEQPPESIAAAYEDEVGEADAASDRLRREADRVQQLTRLEVERQRAAHQTEQLAERREELLAQRRQLTAEWCEVWRDCLVEPGEPAEMRGWLGRCERVARQAASCFDAQRRAQALDKAVAASRARLCATLAQYGDTDEAASLAELRQRAEERLEGLTRLAAEQERLTRALAERQGMLAEKKANLQKEQLGLADWREGWQQAVAKLPLEPATATPEQVTALLDQLDTLFARVGKLHDIAVRIKAIERNRAAYGQAVAELVREVAPQLTDQVDTEAITVLHRQLVQAKADADKREELRHQQTARIKEKQELSDTVAKAQSSLAGLCREVGCASHEDLPALEQRWRDAQRLGEALQQVEEEIVNDGGGLTLAERGVELEGVDADLLQARLDSFESDLKELNRQKEEKGRELYEMEAKLARMDGNDRGAAAAEEAALAGAEVGRAVNRYLRVKLAGALLRRRIDEHRRSSQSPVLALANSFFERITGGRFSGLVTDFDDEQQILVGMRAGGAKVRVEAMSDGTRDQLYLALRLAYLAHELEKGSREPMPLVLDDLLINFDDERAAAALEILAELAAKTQIIYFTHHAHLVELAREAVPADLLQIRTLSD